MKSGQNCVHLRVGHHVDHHVNLNVDHHVDHHNVISTLCEGSETLKELKYKSGIYVRIYGLTGVGARDASASKNGNFVTNTMF